MTVRVVEGKKPYTGGEAINIDENKVISLRLRDENNLIIYDEGDDEIYVDLQLPDGIRPTDAFPVGCNTGRVLVADDWDVTGTIVVFKTTSGDNIKLLYGDDGTLWIDNGTGIFKQIYFKGDVDTIIQSLQTQIDALSGLGRFLSLWDCENGEPISFPLSIPYEYHTGDWFMINVVDNTTNYKPTGSEWDDTPSTTVETNAVEIGDVYIYDGTNWLLQKNGGGGGSAVMFSQVLGSPYDNTNLATALNAKQGTLTAGTNITIDSSTNTISATGGGSDIVYATQAEYTALLPGAESDGKHYFIYSTNGGGGGWQPGVNTVAYYPLNGDVLDHSNNGNDATAVGTITYGTIGSKGYMDCDGTTYATGTPIIPQTGPFTVSCWEKYDTFYIDSAVFYQRVKNSNGSGIDISMYPSGYLQVWRGWSDWNSIYQINTGQWYNVVLTYSSGSQKMYVNGTLVGTSSHTYSGTPTEFLIGAMITSATDDTITIRNGGPISEIIIESAERSAQEISDYYNQTKADYGIS